MRWAGLAPSPKSRFSGLWAGLFAAAVALAGGCASGPRGDGAAARRAEAEQRPAERSGDRDGVGTDVPPGLARIPDAEPRIEPLRPGGANKPYQALGRDYVPIVRDLPFLETGLASWYGRKFHGRRTASGEVYDMYAMTAAHPTLPIPSYARIRNPANGKEVVVRVNDRGPFHSERIVDLSYAAALRLDLLRGVAPVELQRLTFDEIRAGTWQRGTPALEAVSAVTAVAALPPVPAEPAAPAADVAAAAGATAEPAAIAELAPMRALVAPARGFWVQIGAFRDRLGAEGLQRRAVAEIEGLGPLLATFGEAALFRVQAGPYPSRGEAEDAARGIRAALGLVPLIVERR